MFFEKFTHKSSSELCTGPNQTDQNSAFSPGELLRRQMVGQKVPSMKGTPVYDYTSEDGVNRGNDSDWVNPMTKVGLDIEDYVEFARATEEQRSKVASQLAKERAAAQAQEAAAAASAQPTV